MKIGIITYHSVYNFGANLQAYSTVGYLRNHGFDPIVINWVAKDLEEGYNRSNPPAQAEAHQKFIKNHLPLTEICRSTMDVVEAIISNKIDAVIIGSDAVLQHKTFLSRIRITKRGVKIREKRSNVIFPNPFWGSFIPYLDKGFPVMVMSASSQNMNFKLIRGRLRREIGEALARFKVVTARDEWTRKMVSYLTRGRIVPDLTPDPVFSYNQNIQDQLLKEDILKKFSLPEKYMLFSFKNSGVINENWIQTFQSLVENDGIACVILTMPGGVIFKNPGVRVIDPPLCPTEWYALIKYAAAYIGENMHPVVVALHNSVPFYSFDSYGIVKYKYFVNEKSSKIYGLLAQANFLENRISTLGKAYKCPEPAVVLERVKNFDYLQCSQFSSLQQQRYNAMMKNLTGFENV